MPEKQAFSPEKVILSQDCKPGKKMASGLSQPVSLKRQIDQAPQIQLVYSLAALLVQKDSGIVVVCGQILAANERLTQRWRQSD